MQDYVRPIALAVIKRPQDDAILVFEGYDPDKDETFYRPLGGTIEFGEPSEQTVRRELYEEATLELCDVHYLATIENIFAYRGETGHEIVMVYSVRLAETATWAYDQDMFQIVEDSGQTFPARWIPLSHFGSGNPPLYPTGLLDLLVNEAKTDELKKK
jgi:ADP-ribose pyrophosphatase YjhB (NUDIX family)